MILGDTCTRRCGFCNVKTGKPTWNDPLEPARVARSVARMGLRHAVITSVDRDDMPDYGAHAFVGVIRQIRRQSPQTQDRGADAGLPRPGDAAGEGHPERPDVFNHNVEVVPRLYTVARRGSTWERSNRVLRNAKEMGGDEVTTKSGLMVGLGESFEEMVDALGTLRENHVQVITVGQYLRPTENHLPIVRYWHPDEFKALEQAAYELGFEHVAAGPLVRSQLPRRPAHRADRAGRRPAAGGGRRRWGSAVNLPRRQKRADSGRSGGRRRTAAGGGAGRDFPAGAGPGRVRRRRRRQRRLQRRRRRWRRWRRRWQAASRSSSSSALLIDFVIVDPRLGPDPVVIVAALVVHDPRRSQKMASWWEARRRQGRAHTRATTQARAQGRAGGRGGRG